MILTKDHKQKILKALKQGEISYLILSELGGFNNNQYYDTFNFSLLSNEAIKEIEKATITPLANIKLTKDLKTILLTILQNGYIRDTDFKNYKNIEQPLFREINYNKLSKNTLQELKLKSVDV